MGFISKCAHGAMGFISKCAHGAMEFISKCAHGAIGCVRVRCADKVYTRNIQRCGAFAVVNGELDKQAVHVGAIPVCVCSFVHRCAIV